MMYKFQFHTITQQGKASMCEAIIIVLQGKVTLNNDSVYAGEYRYFASVETICAQGQYYIVYFETKADIRFTEDMAFHMSFSACLQHVKDIATAFTKKDHIHEWQTVLLFEQWLFTLWQMRRMGGDFSYIEQKITGQDFANLSVQQLSMELHMHRSQLTKQFKQHYGMSLQQYLVYQKVKAVKQYLHNNEKLMTIAHHVNWPNEGYVGQQFKKYTGVTVSQYRQLLLSPTFLFAPYLEDFLVALDIEPQAQCINPIWGKQEYLGLTVPTIDLTKDMTRQIEKLQIQHMIMDHGVERWFHSSIDLPASQIYLSAKAYQWRQNLLQLGLLFNREEQALQRIKDYAATVNHVKERMRLWQKAKVACIRVSESGVYLHTTAHSYVTEVLHTFFKPTKFMTANQPRIALSREMQMQMDADFLLITFENAKSQQNQAWQHFEAVQKGQYAIVDFYTWMNFGVISNHKKLHDLQRIFC